MYDQAKVFSFSNNANSSLPDFKNNLANSRHEAESAFRKLPQRSSENPLEIVTSLCDKFLKEIDGYTHEHKHYEELFEIFKKHYWTLKENIEATKPVFDLDSTDVHENREPGSQGRSLGTSIR